MPEEFPGDVLPRQKAIDKKFHLSDEYRRWEEPPKEFRYFMNKIMPAIRATSCSYRNSKGIKCLSDIFTVSDEAFGLVILLNEIHIWEDKVKEKAAGTKYHRKLFVDGHSGNRQGWSNTGLNTYNRLVNELKKRRAEELSIRLEETMLEEYRKTSASNDRGGGSGSDEELETLLICDVNQRKQAEILNDQHKRLARRKQNR